MTRKLPLGASEKPRPVVRLQGCNMPDKTQSSILLAMSKPVLAFCSWHLLRGDGSLPNVNGGIMRGRFLSPDELLIQGSSSLAYSCTCVMQFASLSLLS